MKHKDQRVGVFIDVGNMYHSARALYHGRVNFLEIVKAAVGNRKLIRAIAYAVRSQMPEEEGFFDALNKSGIEVKLKDLQTFVGGAKKGDWDVGIAVDMIKIAPKLDVAVLVSGDGDYVDLLHYVKSLGCRAEIISFGKSTSAKLIEESDDFIDLSSNTRKFLMRRMAPRKK